MYEYHRILKPAGRVLLHYRGETAGKMASYTLEQVQKHTKPDDLWIALHNKGLFTNWLWYSLADFSSLRCVKIYGRPPGRQRYSPRRGWHRCH